VFCSYNDSILSECDSDATRSCEFQNPAQKYSYLMGGKNNTCCAGRVDNAGPQKFILLRRKKRYFPAKSGGSFKVGS